MQHVATPGSQRLNALLSTIGWSGPELAGKLGCGKVHVHRWRTGAAAVPAPVLEWLAAIAAFMAAYPAPDWRTRQRKDRSR